MYSRIGDVELDKCFVLGDVIRKQQEIVVVFPQVVVSGKIKGFEVCCAFYCGHNAAVKRF